MRSIKTEQIIEIKINAQKKCMRHQKAQRYIGLHRLVTIPFQMTNAIPVKVKWQCMLPNKKRLLLQYRVIHAN